MNQEEKMDRLFSLQKKFDEDSEGFTLKEFNEFFRLMDELKEVLNIVDTSESEEDNENNNMQK